MGEKIYTHAHPYTPLLTLLSSPTHLPYSGPILRRIQFAVNNPSESARVLATFPEDAIPGATPWLVSFTDINRRPDTQVWLFSSLESASGSSASSLSQAEDPNGNPLGHFPPTTTTTEQEKQSVKSQLLSLFKHLRNTLVPGYLSHLALNPPAVSQESGIAKLPIHAPFSFLLGTVHASLVAWIAELQSEGKLTIHRGKDVFNAKYCFPSGVFNAPAVGPGTGSSENGNQHGHGLEHGEFRFHDANGIYGIQEHHLDLVKSRTAIPRSKPGLLAMSGVALYHDRPHPAGNAMKAPGDEEGKEEMPIAWAFLGFDGSLCSLHVEEEFRGRGLAAVVAREVMKSGVSRFETDSLAASLGGQVEGEKQWFFADVAVENAASRRVMEKMGGLVGWTVVWIVVEVEADVDVHVDGSQ
ncbi:hypothetical protein BJY04DRAFT_202704 [Aspergillus karnatakaensis]|uniref:uncharacterized protein n=1 Tax=Aspergillus karnatakaensis TaxID=1810916 RepID=UPI003CCD5D79